VSLGLPDSAAEVLPDGRRMVTSAERNLAPILGVLREEAVSGRLLEIASGSGLHAARMAEALPGVDWQPSDVDAGHFRSITAWAAVSKGQIRQPVLVDAARAGWAGKLGRYDAVLVVNLLHLIPATGAEVLLAGLAEVLVPGGVALIYGPFLRDGQATSPGDAAFDASLRVQDPKIGFKDLCWVEGRLREAGFAVMQREMPANNLMLVAHLLTFN